MSKDSRIKRERGGVVSLALDPVEAAIIREAFADLLELLRERIPDAAETTAQIELAPGLLDPFTEFADSPPPERPDDPALARLLPDAYTDDPDANADYRRYTERDLVAGKQANIRILLATLSEMTTGGRVRLDDRALRAWLYALNDLRLALGSRLQVEDGYEEQVAAMPFDDPRLPHFALYEWLTSLQDALVQTQL
jgi:hypothetical protein